MHDVRVRESIRHDAPSEQSEHLRLSNILDQMPVGIGVFDVTGRLFHANRHFQRVAGGSITTLQSMAGHDWRACDSEGKPIDPRLYPGARALRGEVATPGLDFLRTDAAGQTFWVGISAVPLTSASSREPVGAVIVVENIDQRHRAEERRRASEARFRRFAEHSSNALWIANVETGVIEYLSPAAGRIWAERNCMETLSDWEASVHPADRAFAVERRVQVIEGECQRFSYRIVDEAGATCRHVRETSFPIPAAGGDNACIGGIIEDISPDVQIYLVQGHGTNSSDLIAMLRPTARRITTFSCHQDLMNVADVLNPGCIILDMRGAKVAPRALRDLLMRRPAELQVIIIGAVDTPPADMIDALRAGAIDYLVEPISSGALERAVQTACDALPLRLARPDDGAEDTNQRFTLLSRREREVLLGLVGGGTNKSIARTLDISPRTVEVHRAHLMERLNVRSLTELLHLARDAGIRPACPAL